MDLSDAKQVTFIVALIGVVLASGPRKTTVASGFGLTLLIEGFFRSFYGVSGLPYQVPEALTGATNLGFMIMPNYRAWVVVASLVVCLGTWYVIERTKLGALLRGVDAAFQLRQMPASDSWPSAALTPQGCGFANPNYLSFQASSACSTMIFIGSYSSPM